MFVASIQFRNEESPQTCKNKSGKHTRRINMHGDKGWGEDSRLYICILFIHKGNQEKWIKQSKHTNDKNKDNETGV